MKRLFLLILLLTTANIFLASDSCVKSKPVIIFPIKIERKVSYNMLDKMTSFLDEQACHDLGINWQHKSDIWAIGRQKVQDIIAGNPTFKIDSYWFPFPTHMPDSFIRELVEQKAITKEKVNVTVCFMLQNIPQELQTLGLSG